MRVSELQDGEHGYTTPWQVRRIQGAYRILKDIDLYNAPGGTAQQLIAKRNGQLFAIDFQEPPIVERKPGIHFYTQPAPDLNDYLEVQI